MKEGFVVTLHLVGLKLALESICTSQPSLTIPKLMDTIFVINISFVMIGLLSMKFYSKEYLFDV